MTCQITLRPSGNQFTVAEGQTILDAALAAGFTLPYGCKDGACGSCKATIVSGQVDQSHVSERVLGASERAEGVALLCCARPVSDTLDIQAREQVALKGIDIKTMPCRVQTIDKPTHDVAVLTLKLPATEPFRFLAGQYIDILLRDGKKRSFSIANPAHRNDHIELHIRHVPGGEFTSHVFNTLKERDILRFRGPLGTFYLRDDSDKPIIFVVSGTGFAPVKGMIEQAIAAGSQRQMVLYWGCRTLADLYMADVPAQWQTEYPHITFIPVLSEPLPEDNWPGRTGFVHQAVLDDFDSLAGYQVYVCGAPVMVESAQRSFIAERALPEDEFFSDAFFQTKDLLPAP
jgi:CDP-4-dehydro-6-deoxyglucose reductase